GGCPAGDRQARRAGVFDQAVLPPLVRNSSRRDQSGELAFETGSHARSGSALEAADLELLNVQANGGSLGLPQPAALFGPALGAIHTQPPVSASQRGFSSFTHSRRAAESR